jgi:PPOX class probable F420-dependent enzyme
VTVCFALEGDVVYSAVDRKPKRTRRLKRLANVAENPRASLLVDHYEDDDWSRLWWVRADGTGRVLDAATPEAARALDLLASRYAQYRTERPEGPVLAVDVERWSGWSAAG